MGIEFIDPQDKAERETYTLKCKVVVKEIPYVDEQSKENVQRTDQMVFLVPEQSTQMELFFFAWLPEDPDTHHEIAMKAGHPVYGYFKGAVMRRNDRCNQHHIFVMSRGAEEDLKMIKDKFLVVEVLPKDQEYQADYMKDYTLAGNRADDIMKIDAVPESLKE